MGPDAGSHDLWQHAPAVNLLAAGPAASFAQDCQDAWSAFATMPGERLVWQRPSQSTSTVLQTADVQTIASMPGPLLRTVDLGERKVRYHPPRHTPSADPVTSQAAARSLRDGQGNYLLPVIRKRRWEGSRGRWLVRTLADEAGITVLYASGANEVCKHFLPWRALVPVPGPRSHCDECHRGPVGRRACG